MDPLLQQIQAFLSLPKEARARERREAILQALGVPHPSRFIEEVWTSQWEGTIDRLLEPANTRIRPLELADFHFRICGADLPLSVAKAARSRPGPGAGAPPPDVRGVPLRLHLKGRGDPGALG